MQSSYHKNTFWICLIILSVIWNSPAIGSDGAAFDLEAKGKIVSGILFKSLTIMPQLNKLNFGFGRHKGIEYFYEKTVSKIFFQDRIIKAKVIDVSIEGSDITLELLHAILGNGTIKFSFSEKLIKQTTYEGILTILLETLGDENHQLVVLDPDSKRYHMWSCNHPADPSLAARMKREDAEQQGYRPSGFCFKKVIYLPELSVEKAIEAEWSMRLRNYEPIQKESEKQTHLSRVGEKVLKNWPFKLLGYDYAFYLAEASTINAFAIPTGKIIITTALFDSLDNDIELEALLVYAVAHIEQRHSLKEYYTCLEDEEYAEAMKKFATVAGALAGPAGGGISGAINAALPTESCSPQSLIGYQHEYVREADSIAALYFDIHGNDRNAVISLMRKLQFSELSEKLHPDMRLNQPESLPHDNRLERVHQAKFEYFTGGNHFVLERKDKPPVQLDLIYQQIFKRENKIHVYIDEKALLHLDGIKNGKKAISISIRDKAGTHYFDAQEDLITEDVWGASLSFSNSGRKGRKFLEDIEKIVLTVGPARGPNERGSSQPVADYTFVPGKIKW